MANPNVMAKSLHTVTVLVTVAQLVQAQGQCPTAQAAVLKAVELLGYDVAQDLHGLIAQAVKKMNRI